MDLKLDKVIVTNIAALKNKYGAAGYGTIKKSIDALIAADKQRGIMTALIALDDAAAMKALSAPPVKQAQDTKQNKKAIDGVYRKLAPDYIAILGSTDIIPHQDMKNPQYEANGEDPDQYAYGDLPYACEAPYSQNARNFIGPTRVVGRIPDITGGTDPNYLAGLLGVAAGYKPVALPSLKTNFSVSAEIWSESTNLSASNTFGASAKVEKVPAGTSQWTQAQLQKHVHFFNCHGSPQRPQFFGQPKSGASVYPVALDAAYIDGKLQEGTIVAAECCYGGELYMLSQTQNQIGICNVYLKNKAYAFFGSTTIAYGPASGNGQADLICQFFLQNTIRGSSIGRATLEARQSFVRKSSPMGPTDLKTLAQFNLYGDPSLTPMEAPKTFAKTMAVDFTIAERSQRKDRRRLLFREGSHLAAQEPVPKRSKDKASQTVVDQLEASARADGKTPGKIMSFTIQHNESAPQAHAMMKTPSLPAAFHLLFTQTEKKSKAAPSETGVVDIEVLVGKEVGGELVSVTTLRSR